MTVSSVCLSRFFALPLEEDDAGPTRRAPSWALSEIRNLPIPCDDNSYRRHGEVRCGACQRGSVGLSSLQQKSPASGRGACRARCKPRAPLLQTFAICCYSHEVPPPPRYMTLYMPHDRSSAMLHMFSGAAGPVSSIALVVCATMALLGRAGTRERFD